jgi:hypothetical protein
MQVRDDAEMIFFNLNDEFLARPLKKTQPCYLKRSEIAA